MREYDARIVRTPICEVDETSDLVKEIVEEDLPGGGKRRKLKMVSKMTALDREARLMGYYSAEQVEIKGDAMESFLEWIRDRCENDRGKCMNASRDSEPK